MLIQRLVITMVSVIMLFSLSACAGKKGSEAPQADVRQIKDSLLSSVDTIARMRANEKQLESITPDVEDFEPILPVYNPLDEVPVSITVQNESLANIIYIISRNAGMNLVIDPDVDLDRLVTVSFENTSSALVVKRLLYAYDLAWEVRDNVLYIQKYVERNFDLGFINLKNSVNISSGGDILGSALEKADETDSHDASIDATFDVTTEVTNDTEDAESLYGMVSKNIKDIISKTKGGGGDFSIDPVAGSVFVKASPRSMANVMQMLSKLKSRLTKSVVIDARLVEVRLKDEFNMGIDWNYIATYILGGQNINVGLNLTGANGAAISVLTGEDLAGKKASLGATVNALADFGNISVISSPHVRAKHGQPALFTSGTTESYVKNMKSSSTTAATIGAETTKEYTLEVSSVFDGIMLGVVPFITDDGAVDLQVFPIKSHVDADSLKLQDISGTGEKISLPRVSVQNINTSVRVKDGDTVILGGLIDQDNYDNSRGTPEHQISLSSNISLVRNKNMSMFGSWWL